LVIDPIAIGDVEDASVRLWLLDLTVPPKAAQCKWLSVPELDRALQFREEGDRRRYLAAHCTLRLLIQDFAQVGADRIVFSVGPWGKPSLCELSGVYFNVSYTGDRALVGLSSSAEIGVDIEMLRLIEDADELADEYFTQSERTALAETRITQVGQRSFLQGWTRKEACIKAVGLGLSLHPSTFTSGITDDRVVSALPLPNGSTFVDVRGVPLGRDLIGAYSTVLQ
jgi:4'-phosphopantetheinyl transferase